MSGDPQGTSSPPEWPFTRPELMAGLRRYLAAPHLRLLDITPMPLPDILQGALPDPLRSVRGMSVGVEVEGAQRRLALVLKEAPISASGRVLAAVGQREYGVYERLAPHLPVLVPGLVAGDETRGWIVLEVLADLRESATWTCDDYQAAITNLAALHDRFWNLGEDLAIFGWLARPFEIDYQSTVIAAAEAVQLLISSECIPALATTRNFYAFAALVQRADDIAAPLREETHTLLHGDYWPGNIARLADGRQIVFDWQRAAIGPAVLDVLIFSLTTRMMLKAPLSLDETIALYRSEMQERLGSCWDDSRFDLLWDHALMWQFLTHWLRRLAALSQEGYSAFAAAFEEVWLLPMCDALKRRLDIDLPD